MKGGGAEERKGKETCEVKRGRNVRHSTVWNRAHRGLSGDFILGGKHG